MRYRAFISYATADRALGERFQRAIEHYRIPKPLRGVDRGTGVVPKRLTPLFRDRSDANAAGNLGAALAAALAESDALVPLCSPAAAKSPWVNHEIREFKALGRGGRIFPVILSGTPRKYDSELAPDGAFPPALFQRVDQAGTVIPGDDPDPLAADIRPEGDGFDFAKLKVVAALTNIPLTELTERQQEAERHERKIVRIVALVMGVLAIAASVAAVIAYRSAEAARNRLSNAIEMAARRVDDAAGFSDAYGVPVEAVGDLLFGAERDFAELIGEERTGIPMVDLQRGRLLRLFSSLNASIGDRDQQLARAREAVTLLANVPTARRFSRPGTWLATLPAPADLIGEQLAAAEALARALIETKASDREITATLDEARAAATLAGRYDFVARFWSVTAERAYNAGNHEAMRGAQTAALAALDQQRAGHGADDSAVERAALQSDRGQLLLESERHKEAAAEQAAAVAVFESEARAAPDDTNVQMLLAQTLTRHADALYAVSGCWTASLPAFERARALIAGIHERDPSRLDYARALSSVLERMGDVMLQTGQLARARGFYDEMTALRQTSRARTGDSQQSLRDWAVALERQGDLALGEKNPGRALKYFDEARDVRPAEDEAVPIEARDRVRARDLAVNWQKTATARAAAHLPSWRDAYAQSIQLVEPLVSAGKAPLGWLRDVAVFRSSYGDALARAGHVPDAKAQWAAALSLIEQQLKVQPTDPRLAADRQDLAARLRTGKVPAPARATACIDR